MKRNILNIAAAFAILAVDAGAQNLDPTVEVSRAYEGKLIEVHKPVLVVNANKFAYKAEIDKIRYWTVKKGDTLGRIAYRTGVSVNKLCQLNGIKKTTVLRIGRKIRYT